jgi:DNA-binding Lrp family transcriptional regulator
MEQSFILNDDLDETDVIILRELQADGSLSNVELARRVNLSPPATHTRVKRLEQLGYIRQYVALIDREKMGYDMLCFITVSLQIHQPEIVQQFREAITSMPEVLECHHVTGDYDYILKVAVRNRQDLQRFLMDVLTPVPNVAHIHTRLVLSEVKSTTELPLTEAR